MQARSPEPPQQNPVVRAPWSPCPFMDASLVYLPLLGLWLPAVDGRNRPTRERQKKLAPT